MESHAMAHQLIDIAKQLRELCKEIKTLRDVSRDDDYALTTRAELYMAAHAVLDAGIANVMSASSYCDSAARVGDWRKS